jgi:hypothetical protein
VHFALRLEVQCRFESEVNELVSFSTFWKLSVRQLSRHPLGSPKMIMNQSKKIFNVTTVILFVFVLGCMSKNMQNNNIESTSEHPLPFSPPTEINYTLTHNQKVSLIIYDINGNPKDTLVQQVQENGRHTVVPNFTRYTSGMYYYKLTTEDTSAVKRMVILK